MRGGECHLFLAGNRMTIVALSLPLAKQLFDSTEVLNLRKTYWWKASKDFIIVFFTAER